MNSEALDVFKIFEKAHGEDEAKKIITYFENTASTAIEKEIAQKTASLASKEDISVLKEDINELKVLIEKSGKEHFKWMFIFFIPLYLTLLGLILANPFKDILDEKMKLRLNICLDM